MKRRILLWRLALGVMTMIVVGCSPTSTPTPAATTRPTATATPTSAARPTLTATATPKGPQYGGIATTTGGGDPIHFDIHRTTFVSERIVAAQNYNTLLGANAETGALEPELTKEWSTSADGRTVTLRLVDGVKWHDGAPFAAEDVKFSLNRIRMPSKGMTSPRRAQLGSLESIEVPDPLTVILHTQRPQPDLLALFPSTYYSILPKHVVEPLDVQGVFVQAPQSMIGTGPFRFKRAVRGEVYELEKNPNYWRAGLPYLDGFKYVPVRGGPADMDAALRTGRINWSLSLAVPSLVKALENDLGGKVRVFDQKQPTVFTFVPSINKGRTEIFKDVEVRKALSLAVPREAIIGLMREQRSIQRGSLLIPGHPYALSQEEMNKIPGYGGDPEANKAEARRIIEAKGLKGTPLKIMTWGDLSYYVAAATILSQFLTDVGFRADPEIVEQAIFFQRASAGDFSATFNFNLMSSPTVDGVLGELAHSSGGRNYGQYADTTLNGLFLQQSQELNPAKRKELVYDYQKRWLNQFYQIHIGWDQNMVPAWAYVRNLGSHYYQQRMELVEKVWFDKTDPSYPK